MLAARAASSLPLALLFLASVLPSNAQKSEGGGARAGGGAASERRVVVAPGAPLTVECALRAEQRAEWRLDGRGVPADMRPGGEAPAAGGLTARLHAAAARDHHAGLYTCDPGAGASPRASRVRVLLQRPGATEAVTQAAAGAVGGAAEAAPPAAGGGERAADVTDAGDAIPVVYEVRGNLSLDCSGLAEDPTTALVWRVNRTLLEELGEAARKRLRASGAVLRVEGRANEYDFGNYSCAAGGAVRVWSVTARTHAKLPANTNVVEGQKLKLSCRLIGRPYPRVAWTYSNTSEEVGNGSLAAGEALGARVTLHESEQGVAGAELVLEPAARADAGWFRCSPVDARGQPAGEPAVTTLRVKDMYAALWPFLGICAEVFVLCAIILVYEKRRTKPELDDSDTDNHDQKKS